MRENLLQDKSMAFALRIIRLYKYLCNSKKEYIMSKQLMRSGLSIGANIAESIYSQSDADFISKLSISLKEAAETSYWLDLLHFSSYIDDKQYESINPDVTELIKLLTSSIKTVKEKISKQ